MRKETNIQSHDVIKKLNDCFRKDTEIMTGKDRVHLLCLEGGKGYSLIRVNNQLDAHFNVLISLLYMFRATQCSSSGESIVSIHHLVYITLCRWPSGMQVREKLLHVLLYQMPALFLYSFILMFLYLYICFACFCLFPLWPAYHTATYTEWYIPDDVLIQLILLMISTVLFETCREVK